MILVDNFLYNTYLDFQGSFYMPVYVYIHLNILNSKNLHYVQNIS